MHHRTDRPHLLTRRAIAFGIAATTPAGCTVSSGQDATPTPAPVAATSSQLAEPAGPNDVGADHPTPLPYPTEDAASTAAAITAAKAATVTAAAAKPVAAAIVAERIMRSEIRRRAAAEAVETLFPETVALVPSPSTAFIVTHNSKHTFAPPRRECAGSRAANANRRGAAMPEKANPPHYRFPHSGKSNGTRTI